MEKKPRNLFFRATPWIFLLLLPFLIYADLFWGKFIHFDQRIHYISSSETVLSSRKAMINKAVEEKQEPLDFPLSRLVKDEDQEKLKSTGFACNSEVYSLHCVTNRPVWIDTRTMTVTIPSNQPVQDKVIRPYARQEDKILLKSVTPVKILQGNTTTPFCQYNHEVPAVIFSSSGFVGNVFHEMNEIIIPLFITTRQFKSRVQFILEDYNPSFIRKYRKPLSKLTSYDIINPSANQSVHCFPGAVIGLKFHNHLAINSSEIPKGLSMRHLRDFLRESLNLKYSHVSQIKTPTVMFLSRRTTRRIINEDEIVSMMEELGFRVIIVARAKVISNLELFASMINSCSVFVGAHGAGLTNEVFLPDGAVMVQVDLIGLEWAGATYYGNPARAMGVHYLRYKIEPEESSLMKIFGNRNHIAFTDPKGAFPVQAGKEVYLNGQNAKINVTRFRETMVVAMSLVRDSEL
ncbi:hypothetical protein BUALT_Bualt03G0113500 [Buddleja alternifolia]|uniref:Glycosyltransferase 61 catalytic domain-containing protein n=1 Tax=Buddleja alternifolia TaxID=168488 RepID=A0AAV6XSW2_9LAMI|nr:hypothetical protein BUALT_Bualt03G0113500 [Buddleja alternifolia]